MKAIKYVLIVLLLSVMMPAVASASALYFYDVNQPKDIYGQYVSYATARVVVANFDTVGHTYIVVVSGTRSDGLYLSGATYNVYLPPWTFQLKEVRMGIPNKVSYQGDYTLRAGIYEGGWSNQMAPISFPRTLTVRP